MALNDDNDDDFGLSSGDEAGLLALTELPINTTAKRKEPPTEEMSQSKKAAFDAYPTGSSIALDALTRSFGLGAFRLKQEAVIGRILGGGSAVVVFPTGGGKSLCYQIPALAFAELDKVANIRGLGESGITLVVSPLIALMKDQVDALVRLGIKAACMDSTKSREEHLETCDMLHNGTLKLLYCAPERLNNEGFVSQMKNVRGGIRLVAVDEAHCISEWGHAFRPDYLKVARFVKEIKAERVICLTATATPKVAHDVCEAFDVDKTGLFRTATYRPNLHLMAESSMLKQPLYPRLFDFLRSNPGPSIVYVTLQKQTEALADDFRNQGFKAKAFHAGMPTAQKTSIQDDFMSSNDLIIVATIAFGMGIDKANIRNVIHFNIPNSLESYSQEIGRAGRDGKPSTCMFYLCGEDFHLRDIFARGDLPSRESLHSLLKDIFNSTNAKLAIGETFQVAHNDQGKEFDIRPTTLNNIYAQLELRFGLVRAITPIYTDYTYKLGPTYSSTLASDKSPAAAAIKAFVKAAKVLHHVDVTKAATSHRIPRYDIVRKLNEWNESQVIELKVAGVMNLYRILNKLPDTPEAIEQIFKELYSYMEQREQQALTRTKEVVGLITGSACLSRSLAQHFGDDLPSGRTECGHCNWCLTHEPVKLRALPEVAFDTQAFENVLCRVPARDDARFLARVAFGIPSPRVTAMGLARDPIYGSMADHDFEVLLSRFTARCSIDNQRPSAARYATEATSTAKTASTKKAAATKSVSTKALACKIGHA